MRDGLERRQFWAFGIFSRPPKRLWTRNQAGALPAEAVRCTLSVGHEVKTEIPGHKGVGPTLRPCLLEVEVRQEYTPGGKSSVLLLV